MELAISLGPSLLMIKQSQEIDRHLVDSLIGLTERLSVGFTRKGLL